MRLSGTEFDEIILDELGSRIRQNRIACDLTQEELANRCGLSLSTIARIENGADARISNYIRILQILHLPSVINGWVPEREQDLKALYERKPERKRVKVKKKATPSKWVWGDEKKEGR